MRLLEGLTWKPVQDTLRVVLNKGSRMCAYRLFFRLTRVPSFLLFLLHLFGGSTWNVNQGGGGEGGRGREGGGSGGGGGGRAGARGGGGLARGQELPSRDEGHFQFVVKHPEVFVDTKSLPDGKEETVYLDKGKPTRFFFIVEAEAAVLSLIVSPCSSRMSWRFSYLYPTPNEGHDKDQDLDEDDELQQQRKTSSPSSSLSSNRNSSRLLKSYTGYDVSGFEMKNPDSGVYSLVIVNDDRDGSVRLFASTSPQSDSPFPLPPGDRTVRITSSSSSKHSSHFPFSSSSSSSSSRSSSETDDSSKVHLTWKRSPTEERHRQPIEYCLSANNFGHLKTYCAARALALGDPRPTLPPYAGFGTRPDRTRGTGRSQSGGRTLREFKRRAWLTCVGSKTSFTFSATPSALVNGRTFYFDVFAVNRRTQSSVAYEGVQWKPVAREKVVQLKSEDVRTFRLKTPSDYMLFRFKVVRPPPKFLLFSFRACVGLVRVEISRGDEILYENRTVNVRPLQFLAKTSASPDTYDILVSNGGKGSASFQVVVTSATKEFPFPDIPSDAGIRVVQSDCHSLELSWPESNPGRTYYCLVVEPSDSVGWKRNRCMIPRPTNEKSKILCHPSRSGDSTLHHPQLHNQTVTDLKEDLSYRLTVYVRNRNRDQYVSYPPVVASTRQECRRSEIQGN